MPNMVPGTSLVNHQCPICKAQASFQRSLFKIYLFSQSLQTLGTIWSENRLHTPFFPLAGRAGPPPWFWCQTLFDLRRRRLALVQSRIVVMLDAPYHKSLLVNLQNRLIILDPVLYVLCQPLEGLPVTLLLQNAAHEQLQRAPWQFF